MAGEGAHAPSIAIHLPQLDATVHGAGEQQMCRLGKPSNGRDALVVTRPGVYVGLGQKTFRWRRIRAQIDAQIVWRMQIRAALVIVGILDCGEIKY